MIEAKEKTISDAIAKVGFWRRKTLSVFSFILDPRSYIFLTRQRYLKQTAQRLRDEFASDVPKTVDELCSLPGVGPKMAFLALQVAWNL
jgi:endonuclease-3